MTLYSFKWAGMRLCTTSYRTLTLECTLSQYHCNTPRIKFVAIVRVDGGKNILLQYDLVFSLYLVYSNLNRNGENIDPSLSVWWDVFDKHLVKAKFFIQSKLSLIPK